MGVTHIAYSDESQWNVGRYRSIALATCPATGHEQMKTELAGLLQASGVQEFKWAKLKTAKYRFAAEKLVRFTFKYCDLEQLRADVLVWDVEDSRHKIRGRDDTANLGRMYYHLLKSVLVRRWDEGASWRICPDEHSALDWKTLARCLHWKSSEIEARKDLFTGGEYIMELHQHFNLREIAPAKSHESPFVQLADLWAGVAQYSHESFDQYGAWLQRRKALPLFDAADKDSSAPSAGKEEKCSVLCLVNGECKKRKLGVALETSRGLHSHKPSNRINFWLYEPQREEDTAPTRSRSEWFQG